MLDASRATGLWARSSLWRWTVVLTCLTTAVVALLGPWNRRPPTVSQLASYRPAVPVHAKSAPVQTPPRKVSAATGHDESFDVAVTPDAAGFPPGTELHVVGVQAGALPNGQKEPPWWAKCVGDTHNQAALMTCHQQYAGQHTQKTVTVTLSGSLAPKVIALLAYEPVKWKIVGAEAANVRKIIVGGYHGQDVEGVNAETPVEVYSYESSPCRSCIRQPGYFYAYRQDTPEYTGAMQKLKLLTGLSPTSFQGAERSERFSIMEASRARAGASPKAVAKRADPVVGQRFVDRITLAGIAVPLPEGAWQGWAYIQKAGDELAVLARTERGKLLEMAVIRARFASGGSGFPRHAACEAMAAGMGEIESNEAAGQQLCFRVVHDTSPWAQPIFDLAANRLSAEAVELPGFFVNSVFHRADKSSALTVAYLLNPEAQGIVTPKTAWDNSPWHTSNLNQFPDKAAFMGERLQWAKSWFQIFKATR